MKDLSWVIWRNETVPQWRQARAAEAGDVSLQTRVDALVYAYRTLGHTIARLDPLAEARPQNPLLSLRELGFSDKDLNMQVHRNFSSTASEWRCAK